METDKLISTRGLKDDAHVYGELILDVNSAYFHNHGGYEFAKLFYADAYRAAVEIVGGEQYVLSDVLHADERNRAMSEALRQDVFHYQNTLSDRLEDVISENRVLRNLAENYERVSRAYGPECVSAAVDAVKRQEQAEKEKKRISRQRQDRVSR